VIAPLTMMITRILLLAALISFNLCAQPVTVKGTISGHRNQKLEFADWDLHKFQRRVLSTFATDSNGHFEATFPLDRARPVHLVYKNGRSMLIWLEPGKIDSVIVLKPLETKFVGELEILDKGATIFYGDHAALNNFLFEADISLSNPKMHQAGATMSPEHYSLFLDSMERARIELLHLRLKDRVSAEAEQFIYGEIVSNSYYHKSMYPVYRSRLGPKHDSTRLNPSEVSIDWSKWKFLSDSALISDGYRSGLQAYFSARGVQRTGKVTSDSVREQFFAHAFRVADYELVELPGTREFVTSFYLYHLIGFVERFDSAVVLAQSFRNSFPDSPYYPAIKARLDKKQRVRKAAPMITAYDSNDRSVTLKDWRGKIVYIDVWASYCKPCLEEFPNAVNLAAKFKNEPVQFVYLNLHDSKSKWTDLLIKHKLPGINLRAAGEMAEKIKRDYGINFIPRYILIDKRRHVISLSAKGPREVEDDILKALKIAMK